MPHPDPFFSRVRPFGLLVLLPLLFAGCSESPTTPALPFEEVRWAASLGVNPADFTELATGVWIRDDQVGEGPAVGPNSRIVTHYRGFLSTGLRFDSSLDNGGRAPLDVRLGTRALIRGFELGAVGMRPGGVRTVLIPPFLGYGSSPPAGSSIPRNAWLVFEIHLVSTQN